MTNGNMFRAIVARNGRKMYEVSSWLGISRQALYSKVCGKTDFSQTELGKFRSLFPDVTDDEFKQIFFAVDVTAHANA